MPVGTVFWMLTDRMLQSSSLLRAPASHSIPAPVPGAVPEKLPRSASPPLRSLLSPTPSSVTAFLCSEPHVCSGSVG